MLPTTRPSPTPIEEPQGRECFDDAYRLNGIRWDRSLGRRFNPHSVPGDLDAERALEVVKQAFANVTEGRNLCGRPDNVHARAHYLGPTVHPACSEAEVRWHHFSVVSFGQMPEGYEWALAIMCDYYYDDDRVAATDILINVDEWWTLSHDDCRGTQHILEAVMTHEVGHAFGLDHVGQRRHGDLTMRPFSDYCDYGDATLGLGDLLGLEELYSSPPTP